MLQTYPDTGEIELGHRPLLQARLRALPDGISELTFSGLYLFRRRHGYRIARLDTPGDLVVITGQDGKDPFFMLPLGLPPASMLAELFGMFGSLKCASASQARVLESRGYQVVEDRDDSDYLYLREELAELPGRRFHRKRNLLSQFLRSHEARCDPLLDEDVRQARAVLEAWREEQPGPGDVEAAREALDLMHELQLCGILVFVDGEPAAWTLGEENAGGESFVVHFEKAVHPDRRKGIYQFLNQAFARLLPAKYRTINREQDLGDPGLRRAKESYRPTGFVKKYRVRPAQQPGGASRNAVRSGPASLSQRHQ